MWKEKKALVNGGFETAFVRFAGLGTSRSALKQMNNHPPNHYLLLPPQLRPSWSSMSQIMITMYEVLRLACAGQWRSSLQFTSGMT